jgi:hypothetical protein
MSSNRPAKLIDLFDACWRDPSRVLARFAAGCDEDFAWDALRLITRIVAFAEQSIDGVGPDRLLVECGGQLTPLTTLALFNAGLPSHTQKALDATVTVFGHLRGWPKAGAAALLGGHADFVIAVGHRIGDLNGHCHDNGETSEGDHHSIGDSFIEASRREVTTLLPYGSGSAEYEAWISRTIAVVLDCQAREDSACCATACRGVNSVHGQWFGKSVEDVDRFFLSCLVTFRCVRYPDRGHFPNEEIDNDEEDDHGE